MFIFDLRLCNAENDDKTFTSSLRGQHQKSRPLAQSNDIPVLNGFAKLNNRLRPEPIRFVRLDSEYAQSNGKSVNRGLPVLDLARGRDSWC